MLAWLDGPTLLTIAGRDRSRTRGVATLLHGNEPSGLRAIVEILRSDPAPATDVVCLVGAVEAARTAPAFTHRMLTGRRDLNRCFRAPYVETEGEAAREALHLLRQAGSEALVDLHNNTGRNPVYGVGTNLGAACLNLASLFGERYVWSDLRLGSLIEETADDFPSVTIECGRAGDPAADAAALAGLRRYLALPALETRIVTAPRMTIFSDPIRVCVRQGLRLAFGTRPVDDADVTLGDDIDSHNFQPVLPGAPIGWIGRRGIWPLEARGADGEDVSQDLFVLRDGRLETRRGVVPIMMTTDPGVAAADCLFYVVQVHEEIGGGSRVALSHQRWT
jgi:hypothetical protein